MAAIRVSCERKGTGWTGSVTVEEGGSSTRHTVEVPGASYAALTGGRDVPVETLLERSFEFLLEREPKESILGSFGIDVITRYFPEYPEEIRKRI